MRSWNEIIAEARDRNKEKAERERRLGIAKSHLKGSDALKKVQGKRTSRLSPEELKLRERDVRTRERKQDTKEQDIQRKKEHSAWVIGQATKNAEERKKKQLQDIKDSPRKAAGAALSSISKPQSISYKDGDATAYSKAIGNAASLAGGVAKAGIHYLVAKHKAKKAAAELEKKDGGGPPPPPSGPSGPPPPPPGGGGNPPKPPGGSSGGFNTPKPLGGLKIKSKKKLIPSTKRLPPSGGTQPSSIGKSMGQQARENPQLRKKLIDQRNQSEEYSNWRDELLAEQGLIFEVEVKDEVSKEEKKKIIEVMPPDKTNKIEINPNIKEEKDEEGGMARNELATMERAVKTLRKKIKSSNQQLPAWVQSKISKATDHIDTVADYMSGETEPVSEECGCEDNEKKVLAMMIIKKAVDAKKKKNFQLNSGIIGEESAAWQRKEGKNPEGGLNAKGRASAKAQGHNLKPPVTTPPSKLDPDSKAAKRRKSFCARMGGMPGPMKDEKGRPTRKSLSLRKWNC
jgi:hypothetical protein